jgi:hypothetical protein
VVGSHPHVHLAGHRAGPSSVVRSCAATRQQLVRDAQLSTDLSVADRPAGRPDN